MIHSLFILNKSGTVIIEKHWKTAISRQVCEAFWAEVSAANSPEEVSPVISTPKNYLIHIQRNGKVQTEVPPLLVIEFLHRVADIFEDYFQDVTEKMIKENFITVYQLLDEMMDNGFPLHTEPNVLKQMILPPTASNLISKAVTGKSQVNTVLPTGSLSSIPWRREGVKYSSNEIYFDVIEEIDAIIDNNGMLVSCEINGTVHCNSHLSGMPDLLLHWSNPNMLEDCSLHPCVRYNRWEHERVVSFIPPDGIFKLMTYRVHGVTNLPIYVKPQITFSKGSGHVQVMVGFKETNGKAIEEVTVKIPFPSNTSHTSLSANWGNVLFDESTKVCRWEIGRIPKEKSPQLTGTVALNENSAVDSSVLVTADFKVPMFSVTGLRVDSMAVLNEPYKPYKGVRFVTKAGTFQIRT